MVSAHRADEQDVAGAFAEEAVHRLAVVFHEVIRDEGLDGAGKAAAVDAGSAPVFQDEVADREGHRNGLSFEVPRRVDVLEVLVRGVAGRVDRLQEGVEVTGFQRRDLGFDPLVLLVPVDGTEHRAVAVQLPEFRKFGEELRFGNFLQDRPAEVGSDLLHLRGNGRIVRGQVGVGALGVGDAEAVAECAEVGVDAADLRVLCVRKVDGHEVADRTGHLVEEAAGFAKVLVLRHLRGFRHLDGRDGIVVVKTVKDGAE